MTALFIAAFMNQEQASWNSTSVRGNKQKMTSVGKRRKSANMGNLLQLCPFATSVARCRMSPKLEIRRQSINNLILL